MTELLFFMLKQNRKKNSLLLTEKYTVAFIFVFYICSFNLLNALLNTPDVPENKALFVLFVYYVYL